MVFPVGLFFLKFSIDYDDIKAIMKSKEQNYEYGKQFFS